MPFTWMHEKEEIAQATIADVIAQAIEECGLDESHLPTAGGTGRVMLPRCGVGIGRSLSRSPRPACGPANCQAA
jgi:hypothetical protein